MRLTNNEEQVDYPIAGLPSYMPGSTAIIPCVYESKLTSSMHGDVLQDPVHQRSQKFIKVFLGRTFGGFLQKRQLEKQKLVAVRILRFLHTEHGPSGVKTIIG
jgi:hypothetical protein